jgi:hypothetical protein
VLTRMLEQHLMSGADLKSLLPCMIHNRACRITRQRKGFLDIDMRAVIERKPRHIDVCIRRSDHMHNVRLQFAQQRRGIGIELDRGRQRGADHRFFRIRVGNANEVRDTDNADCLDMMQTHTTTSEDRHLQLILHAHPTTRVSYSFYTANRYDALPRSRAKSGEYSDVSTKNGAAYSQCQAHACSAVCCPRRQGLDELITPLYDKPRGLPIQDQSALIVSRAWK